MALDIVTIDFHVTSECSQSCPYCWGPRGYENAVDTATALEIITRIKEIGARRIVFTGGDPMQRSDIGKLIHYAKEIGLETALSATGDHWPINFLEDFGSSIDLISLPLDGPNEKHNSRTKEEGHFAAVMATLDHLRDHANIDVKLATPVTRKNLDVVPEIYALILKYARSTKARVFYNIFQAFPRSTETVDWDEFLVTNEEFAALAEEMRTSDEVKVNFLNHATLDKLYFMIFPDGSLVIPKGSDFSNFGPFLDIEDFELVVEQSQFDTAKHVAHSKGWSK